MKWWIHYDGGSHPISKEQATLLEEYTQEEFEKKFGWDEIVKDKELYSIAMNTNCITLGESAQMVLDKRRTGKWVAPRRRTL